MHIHKKNIVFTGGGTGGHIVPLLSLIDYAKQHKEIGSKCGKMYWIGEKGGMEDKETKDLAGVRFVGIVGGKMRRYWTVRSTWQNIIDIGKVCVGFVQSLRHLSTKRVDIVFCKGGYVALPVCYAAYVLRIPVLVHESDMHPGLTNRLVARIAKQAFTGFDGVFSEEIPVGQIFSGDLADYNKADIFIQETKHTHVLVMGGSQGAQVLYEGLLQVLEHVDLGNMQFHVLLGTKNQHFRKDFEKYPQVTCYGYISQVDIASIYSVCDISITRGGVTSLAEQELFGIHKIIVPHPHGGGYHQLTNALWYADAYGDYVLEEGASFQDTLEVFLKKNIGYKKQRKKLDIDTLSASKKTIWSYILNT